MLAALREWHRVLKPGGQVGFSGFGPTFLQPLRDLWEARLRQYGVSLPTGSQDHRLAEPETCRRLLHEAGFVQTEVQSEQQALVVLERLVGELRLGQLERRDRLVELHPGGRIVEG